MKIAFVPRTIRRLQNTRERSPWLASVLPCWALRSIRKRWAVIVRPRKREKEWLRDEATPPMLDLLHGLERGGRWLASANGVAIGLSFAWMISAYGEMYAGYSDIEQKGCVLARAAAHTVQQTAFFAKIFTFGGGFAILAAGAVNMHKIVWAFSYFVRARPPLRGILVQPPKWRMSLKFAVNLSIAQAFLLFVSMTFLGTGMYAVLSTVAGETPQTLLDTRNRLQYDCRIVLEQAP